LWTSNETLMRFLEAARVGDLHTILDLSADEDLQMALDRNDADDEYRWERLLALSVAHGHFRIRNVESVLVDYAETRFWCYDDEGYGAQTLDVYLGILYSVDTFGVRDPLLAYESWEAALDGPHPEGAQEDLARIKHRLDDELRARLAPLMAR
jgi:hypothetical protein